MNDCDDIPRAAAIACLTEMLNSGMTDPDLALQVCQAMMNPRRRELIMMATLCHDDNLDNIAAQACACGDLNEECDAVRVATSSGDLPCLAARARSAITTTEN